jgi:XTP/dITP diphosphohydrolase
MCLAWDEVVLGIFEGAVEGRLLLHEEGEGGFGYDPLFLPKGFDKTLAEMDLSLKNMLSHRGLAMKEILPILRDYLK